MRPITLKPDDSELSRKMVGLLDAGDWDAMIALLRGLPPESAYAALRLLGECAPFDADVAPLIGRATAWDLTVAGALLQARAMRFRGTGTADMVGSEQWELYIPTLAQAQALLAEANALAPDLGLAAAWRVTAFIDASDEDKDAAERALRAAQDVPVVGLSRLLTLRAQKWGGSHEAMWNVVREHARPEAPATMALIAKAHFEQWLWLVAFEEDPEQAARGRGYFREPAVRDELAQASAVVLAGGEARDPRALLMADNWFAFVLATAGLYRKARPHLRRIGRNVDRSIWLAAAPLPSFERARRRAWLLPLR